MTAASDAAVAARGTRRQRARRRRRAGDRHRVRRPTTVTSSSLRSPGPLGDVIMRAHPAHPDHRSRAGDRCLSHRASHLAADARAWRSAYPFGSFLIDHGAQRGVRRATRGRGDRPPARDPRRRVLIRTATRRAETSRSSPRSPIRPRRRSSASCCTTPNGSCANASRSSPHSAPASTKRSSRSRSDGGLSRRRRSEFRVGVRSGVRARVERTAAGRPHGVPGHRIPRAPSSAARRARRVLRIGHVRPARLLRRRPRARDRARPTPRERARERALYARERRLAESLQLSLLPRRGPHRGRGDGVGARTYPVPTWSSAATSGTSSRSGASGCCWSSATSPAAVNGPPSSWGASAR